MGGLVVAGQRLHCITVLFVPVHFGVFCFYNFDHYVDVEAPHDDGLQRLVGDVIVGCDARDVVLEAEYFDTCMQAHIVFLGAEVGWLGS